VNLNPITKKALSNDQDWIEGEGYIIIWEETHGIGDNTFTGHYIYGGGINGAGEGGWKTARYATIYPSYSAATSALHHHQDSRPRAGHNIPVDPRLIRIVKVRLRKPVEVLEDLPADLLEELANL
jgi:hypothetical protein